MTRKEILDRLLMERTKRRWSQAEVERRARKHFKAFPKGKYWRIENGYDEASDKEQAAICKALKVHRDTIFNPDEVSA